MLWGKRGSNSHALPHMILSHACLPIPALPLEQQIISEREKQVNKNPIMGVDLSDYPIPEVWNSRNAHSHIIYIKFLGWSKWKTQRYVRLGSHSFYGEYLYDQIVPQDHFLKLRQIIAWEKFTRKLIRLYKGEGVVGRPPFDPALVLKVELISYLCNLSGTPGRSVYQRELTGQVLLARSWPLIKRRIIRP